MCPGLNAVRMVVYELGMGEEEKLPPPCPVVLAICCLH